MPPATHDPDPTQRTLGVVTATLLVVASMIGTGIFTTTGFMVRDVPSLPAILFAWVLGGAAALLGALAYAELAACMPRNGGEYHILSRLFHPAIGFTSAWVSLIVGFCAPIAATALAFAKYLETVIPGGYSETAPFLSNEWVNNGIAITLVLVLTLIHLMHVAHGSRFQNMFTIFKVVLLSVLIIAGLSQGDLSRITDDVRPITAAILNPGFAFGLVFISYAYTGWNAAAYMAGEIREPRRNLPIALCLGTLIVTALFLGLNVVYLTAVPRSELAGVETVANTAIIGLFGTAAARWMTLLIVLGLVSMAGALIMTGSRVYETVGQDFPQLRWFALRRGRGGPHVALIVQAAVAVIMIVVGNLQILMAYVGFTLSLFSALAVGGVFVLRRRYPQSADAFRMPGYPLTPLLFILFTLWIVGMVIYREPNVAIAGLGTLAAGGALYWVLDRSPSHNDAE